MSLREGAQTQTCQPTTILLSIRETNVYALDISNRGMFCWFPHLLMNLLEQLVWSLLLVGYFTLFSNQFTVSSVWM